MAGTSSCLSLSNRNFGVSCYFQVLLWPGIFTTQMPLRSPAAGEEWVHKIVAEKIPKASVDVDITMPKRRIRNKRSTVLRYLAGKPAWCTPMPRKRRLWWTSPASKRSSVPNSSGLRFQVTGTSWAHVSLERLQKSLAGKDLASQKNSTQMHPVLFQHRLGQHSLPRQSDRAFTPDTFQPVQLAWPVLLAEA